MTPIQGHYLIKPEDLAWRLSNMMKIPNADYLERTASENLGARLWRMPPWSANTLHKHARAEEFYFVLEGTGRMRIGDTTLTVSRCGAVLVGPEQLRQVFNDTDAEVTWLIIGGPEEQEFLPTAKVKPDLSVFYPVDPKQLPRELQGVAWPPPESAWPVPVHVFSPPDFARLTQDWLEAWNAHDLERILAHYTDDVEFFSPFIVRLTDQAAGVLHGKSQLRDYFARGLKAYPELHFEFLRLYTGVRSCVLEYRSVNNLRAAETMEFNSSGKVGRVQVHYSQG